MFPTKNRLNCIFSSFDCIFINGMGWNKEDLSALINGNPDWNTREDYLQWDEFFISALTLTAHHNYCKTGKKSNAAMVLNQKKQVIGTGCRGNDTNDGEHAAILALVMAEMYHPHFVYLKHMPCMQCAKYLTEKHVKEVVFFKRNDCFGTEDDFNRVQSFLTANGVALRKFVPDRKNVCIDFSKYCTDFPPTP